MKTKQLCKGVLLMILMLISMVNSPAQKLDKKLDDLISKAYPAGEPGATVLVAKEGLVMYEKAFGMANLELNIPMGTEMVFEIGSITKQFTAVAILMLMEEGKLSLDDEITKFMPDYPTHGHTITIHHLLTHTSGIRSYTSVTRLMEKGRNDYKPMELIKLFWNEPMDFAPGEQFLYNNSAFFILGYIIEKESGMTYPEFIENRIFNPLGMKNSYFGSQKKIIPNRAYGYQKSENQFQNAEYLSLTIPYAAGSLMSNIEDLLIWNTALKQYTLVARESLEKAYTNYTLNNGKSIDYGYGWFLSEINGSPTIEHGGGIYGYTTNAIYLPEEDVYVAVLTNRDDKGPGVISTRVAGIAIGKPYPDPGDGIELSPDVLKKFVGVYEFEDGAIRYIFFEEDKLFSQREGSVPFPIFPLSERKFAYEGSLSSISFAELEDEGMSAIFESRVEAMKGIRTSLEIPEEKDAKEKIEGTAEIKGKKK